MKKLPIVILILLAGPAGCATYQAKPLSPRPDLPRQVPHLSINPAQMPLPELARHKFDPGDGLDMTEVAMLAVANNPALKVARDEAGIARAQAFAAGLLPDPQIGLAADSPTNGGPGNTSAFNLGLSYDVSALLTRSAAKGAAVAARRQTDLTLLWQEWQVVSRARLLFVRNLEQQRLMDLLGDERAMFARRYNSVAQALEAGNATLEASTAELSAMQDVDRRINDTERRMSANRHELNALLGLAPDAKPRLVGDADLPPLDGAKVRAALADLARRRPDLLALQAGYESQELRFRQAVLAQFPAINIGLTRARDTSGLYTRGFGITLSLPIFNRNRGNIAIEKATRRRLYDEFQMRLNGAAGGIDRILSDQALLEKQLHGVKDAAGRMARVLPASAAAYRAGDLDELSYTKLRGAWLAKRMEAVALEQSLLEQRVALQTLMGGELPTTNHRSGSEP